MSRRPLARPEGVAKHTVDREPARDIVHLADHRREMSSGHNPGDPQRDAGGHKQRDDENFTPCKPGHWPTPTPPARLVMPLESELERPFIRSEEHTSELQSLMRISYAVFCLKKKNTKQKHNHNN